MNPLDDRWWWCLTNTINFCCDACLLQLVSSAAAALENIITRWEVITLLNWIFGSSWSEHCVHLEKALPAEKKMGQRHRDILVEQAEITLLSANKVRFSRIPTRYSKLTQCTDRRGSVQMVTIVLVLQAMFCSLEWRWACWCERHFLTFQIISGSPLSPAGRWWSLAQSRQSRVEGAGYCLKSQICYSL